MTRTIKILTLLAAMIITAATAGAQEKKTPTVTTPPTASAITYGQMLAESTVSGGTVTGDNDEVLSGIWMWASPSTMPKVSDSGTTEYSVIFTPDDTENYKQCTTTTKLTVNPIAITITAASDSWTYDGNAHSNTAVTVTSGSLLTGHQLVATATGSVTNVADTQEGNNPIAAGYKIMYGEEDVTANYAITTVAGTLTITKPTNTEAISYIDENGETKSKDAGTVTVLDGTETTLGVADTDTWYVCNTPATDNDGKGLTYTSGLTLIGHVHLILADGCTMSVGTSESRINGIGISSFSAESLTIYGQSTGNGVLSVYNTGDYEEGIRTYDLTINGGHIIADTNGDSSSAISNFGYKFTINGGTVSAIATGTDTHAIYATRNFYYNGGIVNANATSGYAIYANNSDCNLNWRNPDDRIFIGSTGVFFNTEGRTVKIADGQRFVAYNMADANDISASAIVSGTVVDVTLLAGKTLRPLDGNYVSINSGNFDFNESTNTTTRPFTITTGEGENATTTHYYIYKKDDTATLSYTGAGFVNVTGATLAAVENEPLQRQFTMPTTDVALTATAVTAPTITDVTYDGAAHAPVIQQGDPENYVIAYKQGENDVTEAKNVGNYTCTMTGLGQYIGTTSVDFAITKRSTSLAVEIVDPVTTVDGHPLLISGDDAHVKVTLNPVREENETTELPKINGIVTICVTPEGGIARFYTVAIVNGEGHYYVTNLGQGAYNITAEFAGDANHAASTSDPNYSITISKVKTALRICFDKTDMTANTKEVTVGEPVTVNVDLYTVPSDWDGDFAKASPFNSDAVVTVTARLAWKTDYNDHYTLGLVDGHGSITFSHLPTDECNYDIFAVYAGDDEYLQSQTTDGTGGVLKLTVNKTATTVGVEVTSPVIAKEQNYE